MFEDILCQITKLSPIGIYLALFFFSYIENIFPPSPSDMVVVIGGTLIGTGVISLFPTLVLTTIGSVAGFMTLYYLGSKLDKKVIRTKKIKFISLEALDKVEAWFTQYGNWIIAINRFLPGTRSVVSFFAGLSEIEPKTTVVLSAVSALLWNALILTLGIEFGRNVQRVDKWLNTYSNVALTVTVIIVLFIIIRFFYKKYTVKH